MEMVEFKSLSQPLLDKTPDTVKPNSAPRASVLTPKVISRLPATDKILATVYSTFLLWQMAALFVYVVHTVHCCLLKKKVSFQCRHSAIPYSLEVEMALLISLNMHLVFSLWFVRKIPHFMGYKKIVKKLSYLPAFWSMVVLLAVLLIGLAIIQYSANEFPMQSSLVLAFSCHGILITALVGILNYTQGKPIRAKYPFFVFALFKVTLAMLFTENFVLFLIGSLQLAAGVLGLSSDISHNDKVSFGIVRHFSTVMFYYKVSDFLWQKMFIDNRNILHHHDYLESWQTLTA